MIDQANNSRLLLKYRYDLRADVCGGNILLSLFGLKELVRPNDDIDERRYALLGRAELFEIVG